MPRLWKIILFGLGAVSAMIGGHGDPRCHGGEQGTGARRQPASGRERPPMPA